MKTRRLLVRAVPHFVPAIAHSDPAEIVKSNHRQQQSETKAKRFHRFGTLRVGIAGAHLADRILPVLGQHAKSQFDRRYGSLAQIGVAEGEMEGRKQASMGRFRGVSAFA